MQFNCKMGYSGNEQDYQLIKTSISELKKANNQTEVLRYLTNVLPDPTDIVTLDNAQNTVKSVKAQLGNKNLIPYPYTDTTKTLNGITFTVNSDNSITVNGTATAQAYFKLQQSFSLKKGQYFFSGCPTGGAGTTYSLYISNTDYTFYKADIGNGISINSEDDKTVSIVINIAKDTTVNNLVFKPQLELGTTATAYTPYVSDFTTVKVSTYAKNLLNQSTTELGTLAVGSLPTNIRDFEDNTWYAALTLNGYYDPNDSMPEYALNGDNIKVKTSTNKTLYGLSKALKCSPNTTYTLSYSMENGLTKNASGIGFYGADKKHISFAYCDSGSSFTTPSNCYWITVCFHGNTENTYVTYSDIQLEQGSTATDYEPYQGQTYTPTATGVVKGITVLTPTTNIVNDKGLLFTKVIGDDFNYIN